MSSKPIPAREPLAILEFPYQEIGEARAGATPEAAEDLARMQLQRQQEAYQKGLREGEARADAQLAAKLTEAQGKLAAAVDSFAKERREYFLAVEREVVQLACSITRKILRRESTIDPLLLAGMVRVALERINQATRVRLRVPPAQASDFRTFFAPTAFAPTVIEKPPEIVEDSSLAPDVCVLETELGTTEIGPEIQLKEIEQGLLDLQAAKPRANS